MISTTFFSGNSLAKLDNFTCKIFAKVELNILLIHEFSQSGLASLNFGGDNNEFKILQKGPMRRWRNSHTIAFANKNQRKNCFTIAFDEIFTQLLLLSPEFQITIVVNFRSYLEF